MNYPDNRGGIKPRFAKLSALLLVAGAIVVASASGFAQTVSDLQVHTVANSWPLKPPEVAVGGKFRLMFATSTKRNATAGTISTYNDFVIERAKAHAHVNSALGDKYRAFVTAMDLTARHNTCTSGQSQCVQDAPFYWTGGGNDELADGNPSLYATTTNFLTINNALSSGTTRDESGTAITGDDNGIITTWHGFFGNGSSENNFKLGNPTETAICWNNSVHDIDCDTSASYQIYAISPVFTVVANSDDATLTALTLTNPDIVLGEDFLPETTAYTASVANGVEGFTINATPAIGAMIGYTNNRDAVVSDAGVVTDLQEGETVITLTVTAEDGSTMDYTLTVNRAVSLSTDATLTGLALTNAGDATLDQTFAAATTEYTAHVANSVEGFTINATPASGATVAYTPDTVVSAAGVVTGLPVGETEITLTVTAENGTTEQDYILTVTRAGSTPTSDLQEHDVPNAWPLKPPEVAVGGKFRLMFATSTRRDATADTIRTYNNFVIERAKAHANVNSAMGDKYRAFVTTPDLTVRHNTCTSGQSPCVQDAPFYWTGGGDDEIADGSAALYATTGTFTITNSALSSGTARDESGAEIADAIIRTWHGFRGNGSSGNNSKLGNPTATALCWQDSAQDADCAKSNAYRIYAISPVFTVVADSTDATLTALTLANGAELNDAFATATTAYTSDVANDVETFTINVTLPAGATLTHTDTDAIGADTDAMVEVAGVVNGTTILNVTALPEGETVFTLTVTAEDGTTEQDYTLTVTRAAALPDLVITATAPGTGVANEDFTLSVVVTNQGSGATTAAATITFYEDNLGNVDIDPGTADVIGTATVNSGLAAGATSAHEIMVTAPGLNDESHHYGACVSTVPDESDTTNNCSRSAEVAFPAVPDLAIPNAPTAAPSTVAAGANFMLSVAVRNHGAGATTDAATITYYQSTDSTIDSSDAALTPTGEVAIGLMQSNNSTASITVVAPAPNTYYYGACVSVVTGEFEVDNNCSAGVEVTVTAPAPTTTATISGSSGGLTNDNTPPLNGAISAALVAGEHVRIYNGATRLDDGTNVPVAGTTWTFTPTTALNDGVASFTAVVAGAGGEGTASAVYTLTIDATAPTTTAMISGTNGGSTNDDTPALSGTISVALTTGEHVRIYNGTTRLDDGTNTVSVTGTGWTFTPPTALSDGEASLTALVADAAGNEGPASAPFLLTIDTTAPTTTATISGTNGGSTNDNTPALSGTISVALVTGEHVRIYNGTTRLDDGTNTVSVTGTGWTFTPPTALSDGEASLTALVADAAGNEGPASAPFLLTIGTGAPATTATINGTNGGLTNDDTPELSGTISAALVSADGEHVRIYNGATRLDDGTNTVSVTGTDWTFTPPTALSDGEASLTALVANTNGNGPASTPFLLTIDTIAPTTTATISGTNGGATNDDTPALSGTISVALVTGEHVRIYNGSTRLDNGTNVSVSGTGWTFTPTTALSEGDASFTARVADAAGNEGPASATFTMTIDTTNPTTTATISGTNGGLTNDDTPALSGTISVALVSADGEHVRIYDGTTRLDNGTDVSVSGTGWTFTPTTALSEGDASFTARVADAAGNEGPASTAFTLTIDTTAPTTTATISGTNGGSTTDNTPDLSGTISVALVTGEHVRIYNGATRLDDGTNVSVSGTNWTFTPTTALNDGQASLTARVADAAGNEGPASAPPFLLTIDTGAPTTTATISGTNGEFTNDDTPTLSGTISAALVSADGEHVRIYNGATRLDNGADVTVTNNTNWSFTPTTALSEGQASFTALVANTNGNGPASTPPFLLTIDTIAPTTTATFSGTNGGSTTDNTPDLSGTISVALATGEHVRIYDGATRLDDGTNVSVSGTNWTFTPTTALSEGQASFTARVVDAADNEGPASAPFLLTINTGGLSTDATLTNLTLSGASLNEAFASATTTYTASVANSVVGFTIDATPATGATIEYADNTTAVVSTAGVVTGLPLGATVITITVTAADGTTELDYTLTVTRSEAPAETLNEDILTQVVSATTATIVDTVAARVAAVAGGAVRINVPTPAPTPTSAPTTNYTLAGGNSLADIITTHGRAMIEGTMDYHRLLDGAAFSMPLSGDSAAGAISALSLWGSLNYTDLDGDTDGLLWDGTVRSGIIGVDRAVGARTVAGIGIAHTTSAMRYDDAGESGDYDYTTIGVIPYIGWSDPTLQLWSTLGYGSGEITIDPDGKDPESTDATQQFISFGAESSIGNIGSAAHLNRRTVVSVKWDASFSEVDVEKRDGDYFKADTLSGGRLRMLLVGERQVEGDTRGVILPRVELGMRYENSTTNATGGEFGLGLRYTSPAGGFILEGNLRTLFANDYDEWGADLTLRSVSDRSRGLYFSLSPGVGDVSSRVRTLWEDGAAALNDDDEEVGYGVDFEVGYGLGATLLRTPGTLTPYFGLETTNGVETIRLGGKFTGHGFDFGIEGSRSSVGGAAVESWAEVHW